MEKFLSSKAKVSSKSGVVIPKEIREVLGIKPGDEVRFTYWPASIASGRETGRLSVRKVPADPVAASAGMFKRRPGERPWTETFLEERRAEREKEERKIRQWARKRPTG